MLRDYVSINGYDPSIKLKISLIIQLVWSHSCNDKYITTMFAGTSWLYSDKSCTTSYNY